MARISLQKTTLPPRLTEKQRPWYIVDAQGKTLGRLATTIARTLSGRDRADQIPFIDNGAHVIVLNAAQVRITGSKGAQKLYRHHTGYMGGLKERKLSDVLREKPIKPITEAVTGMLPKHSHRKAMLMRLHVFTGASHPHEAQTPKPLTA